MFPKYFTYINIMDTISRNFNLSNYLKIILI